MRHLQPNLPGPKAVILASQHKRFRKPQGQTPELVRRRLSGRATALAHQVRQSVLIDSQFLPAADQGGADLGF